jgi:hypothetical protein
MMMAGDTLVTISLAGSLFFSVSPTEAKSKVLLYLLLTLAPFAVVSPLLGPLIDHSSNGRRVLVATSAAVRVVLCWSMSQHLQSLWLFPEAFVLLVSSKLYVVTRGTLVPEMARTDQFAAHGPGVDDAGWPLESSPGAGGFSGFNAQLTLIGTVVGLVGGSMGVGILKGLGAPSVLIAAAVVYAGGVVVSLRLRQPNPRVVREVQPLTGIEADLQALRPHGDREVSLGLVASSSVRMMVGFTTFLLAFGLRREHSGVGWFAAALTLSAVGSLGGLAIVTRWRQRVHESTLLLGALVAIGLGGLLCAQEPTVFVQVLYAGWLGAAAAVTQPSFDAITQSHVAAGAQGRTFARFAVRQQLAWVLGALVPVAIPMGFGVGDWCAAGLGLGVGASYAVTRRRTEV